MKLIFKIACVYLKNKSNIKITGTFFLKGLLDSCTESLCQVEALQHNRREILLLYIHLY